jgi:D-lyxose ketol-isomerase
MNRLINDSIHFIDQMGHKVPNWVQWTVSDWKGKKEDTREIIDNYLGWDLTEFGSGDFSRCGLIMLTLRNGNMKHPEKYIKKYAEKILIVQENQLTPTHFHWSKMEDIINRGGGNLVIHAWKSTETETLSNEDVTLSVDGIVRRMKAGDAFVLKAGESVFFEPGVYHKFYGEPGKGKVFVGEISTVNDDTCDNRFLENLPRFPVIEEDEPVLYPLFSEIGNYF